MSDSFVHLHVHTEYSMLDGAARVRELFTEAARMEMPALAVTDHGVMYGAVDVFKTGREFGVKPILGTELYVATRSRFNKSAKEKDGNHHLTAIAASTEGYQNLMKLVSLASIEGYYYRPRVDKELLAQHAKGIIATSGCLAGEVGQLLLRDQIEDATRVVGEYREIFGPDNFFVELQDHGIGDQHTVFPHLIDIARKTGTQLLATNDLHYTRKEDAAAHDVLLCIQTGATIDEPGRFKFDAEEFYLKTPQEMRELFRDYPEACDATLAIAERCEVDLEFGTYRLPRFETPNGEDVDDYLREQALEGAVKRYGDPVPGEVRQRIEYELGVIKDMGFPAYFLIVADLIRFARESGVRVGPGRGSAAGSVVSYCLGIVDLDPLEYGLVFERFLNPGRKEMPDIDMDFDDRRRGDVIRYAAERYGEDHVAQIVTFGTIKGKQAIRDAARVLGLPYAVGDRLTKMYPPSILGKDPPLVACFEQDHEWPDGAGRNEAYQNATDLRQAYESDEDAARVIDIARGLEGLRRQAGVHAAGVVISDVPLTDVVPVWRNEQLGGIVTQYDMGTVADLGLLKMDFLGLRNLTVIEDTLTNLRRLGIELDIDAIPLDDKKTFDLLATGDTVGVFQLGEPGMRELVKRLRPDRFEDIIALVALYRPGPLGANMHKEYVDRKHGRSKVEYLHPDLKPFLEETYGIIVYQEQVMRIATDLAGFSPPEADNFRKAVGKKVHEVMQVQREKFIAGCLSNGYEAGLADELWKLIEFFAGYGFNKSHSACYGFISYQTAYLKAHHPVEYMAALLTSVKDKVDRSAQYLAECRAMGIRVEPPDVNVSDSDFTPTRDGTIRYGLSAVRNVGESVVEKIINARTEHGVFSTYADYTKKVDPICLNRRVVESLAKAGAFDSLKIERSALLQRDVEKGVVISEAAARMADAAVSVARAKEAGQFSLFGDDPSMEADIELRVEREVPQNELLAAEKEMLGVYVSDHPLYEVESALRAQTTATVPDAWEMREGEVPTLAGLVTQFQKRFTRKGEPMAIFHLEDLHGAMEVVVFPSAFATAQQVLQPDAIVVVRGKVDTRDDQPKLIAQDIAELDTSMSADDGGPARPRGANGSGRSRLRTASPTDPLILEVAADRCTPALVDRLRVVLEAHPGPTPVHLRLISDGSGRPKTLKLPHRFTIERRTGLYAELKALLGPAAFL